MIYIHKCGLMQGSLHKTQTKKHAALP